VVELLEAVVEAYTHAPVDTEVVVRFISSATGRRYRGGIGGGLVTRSELGVHHAGEIQAKVIAAALRVSVKAVSVSAKAIAGLERAVHGAT
jgi:hypothetical protein